MFYCNHQQRRHSLSEYPRCRGSLLQSCLHLCSDAAGYLEIVLVMLQSWQAYLVPDIHGATLESRSAWFHERSLPVSQVSCVLLYILDMCVLSQSKCTCMPDANRLCNLSVFIIQLFVDMAVAFCFVLDCSEHLCRGLLDDVVRGHMMCVL